MTGPYLRHPKRSLNACAGSPSKGVGSYKPSYYSCGEAGGNYYSWNDKYGSSSSDDYGGGRSYSSSGGGDGDYTILWIILGAVYGTQLLCWMCIGINSLWKKCKDRRHKRKSNENFRKFQESQGVIYLPKGELPTENDVVSGPVCNPQSQPANNEYWKLILASREAFNDANDEEEKSRIVQSIQDAIATSNGRFVHLGATTGLWYIIPTNEIQSQIKHALHLPNYRKNNQEVNTHKKLPEKEQALPSRSLKDGVPESDETTQSSSTTSASDLSYLPKGEIPCENDVVSGPSSNAKTQPANRLYWKLVLASREAFNDSEDKKEKQEIVESIQDAIAANNGRFLYRDGKRRRWLVLPPNKVQFKIRRALNPRAAVPKYAMDGEAKTPEYGVGAGTFLFQVQTTGDTGQPALSSVDLEAQEDNKEDKLSSTTTEESTFANPENNDEKDSHDVAEDNANNGTGPSLFETVYNGFVNLMSANASVEMRDAEAGGHEDVQVHSC